MQDHDTDVLARGAKPLPLKTVLGRELDNQSAREATHDLPWKRWAADTDSALVDRVAGCWFAPSTAIGDVLLVQSPVHSTGMLRAEKDAMTDERME